MTFGITTIFLLILLVLVMGLTIIIQHNLLMNWISTNERLHLRHNDVLFLVQRVLINLHIDSSREKIISDIEAVLSKEQPHYVNEKPENDNHTLRIVN